MEGDESLVCDWCGHECQDFTTFFGDIRCDECAYEDKTYRREVLGEKDESKGDNMLLFLLCSI